MFAILKSMRCLIGSQCCRLINVSYIQHVRVLWICKKIEVMESEHNRTRHSSSSMALAGTIKWGTENAKPDRVRVH